ncbi:sensor histidine kinase [Scytonema sp. UIC 10036]|uniref:sensor histidine kinase n=1 Tax=Scytonema sp. UIC 10036 TaxID=2304196 RepID=UPI0012DA1C16|nr:sensor histidine kinase [Scytonema sp. UIC 10036]MUG99030.1 sensor histidine kinase [Scytonema sp. UIC 10036]
MKLGITTTPSFRLILRYIEWIMILGVSLGFILDGTFQISATTSLQVILCLVAYTLLSLIFPINRPLWQRQIYVISGIILALFIRFIGIGIELFLYFYIAKSCFLLNRKFLIMTVALTIIVGVFVFVWSLPEAARLSLGLCANLSERQQLQHIILRYLSDNLVVTTFIIAFSFIVIAEQKSRKRAENLAEQVETLSRTLERTEIARDIHDSLGHSLTNLNSRLAVAQQQLRQNDIVQVSQTIDMAKFLANQCIEEVNQSLKTMRQSDFDLNQALTTLVEQLRYDRALSVQWEINLPKLPLQISYHIYYIVKEALINTQKHGRASQVCFWGLSQPEGILLKLEDDGQGFNPEQTHFGFGLRGIEERVQLLGGKLTIHSAPNLGTQIHIRIPN